MSGSRSSIAAQANPRLRTIWAFAIMASLLLIVAIFQSWNVAFSIMTLCIISAIMALGVNIQWGYAGLFNAGIMGFAALGGLVGVLVSVRPVEEAWAVGNFDLFAFFASMAIAIGLGVWALRAMPPGRTRAVVVGVIAVVGFLFCRWLYFQAIPEIELVKPTKVGDQPGFLGGMGLPIILSWPLGGLVAAGAAFLIGKVTLGLRSDYLAIATLGISEIIIFFLKNEDWLSRGVQNVSGLNQPVPTPVELQKAEWFAGSIRATEAKIANAEIWAAEAIQAGNDPQQVQAQLAQMVAGLNANMGNVDGLANMWFSVWLPFSQGFASLWNVVLGWLYRFQIEGPMGDGIALEQFRSASSLTTKIGYIVLFGLVLYGLFWLAQRALTSPWGRMMRAIRDNEVSANAMGKNIVGRHLEIFVLGSAVVGISGAMLTTIVGQFTPTEYIPMRFTFLIWVMVIVGGSGNNFGSIIGGFLIWFVWIQAEPFGTWFMAWATTSNILFVFPPLQALNAELAQHFVDVAPQMRLMLMGVVLLFVLRFSPSGILPEVVPGRSVEKATS